MNKRGFTIVELLIVIVVIGILAAITIVAYSGIQTRGLYATHQSNLKTLNGAILQFKAVNGAYPNTSGGWRSQSGWGDTFIPGIKPDFLTSVPSDPKMNGETTYYYISDGTDYKLLRHFTHTIGLPDIELTNNPLLDTVVRPTWAWGYWTPEYADV